MQRRQVLPQHVLVVGLHPAAGRWSAEKSVDCDCAPSLLLESSAEAGGWIQLQRLHEAEVQGPPQLACASSTLPHVPMGMHTRRTASRQAQPRAVIAGRLPLGRPFCSAHLDQKTASSIPPRGRLDGKAARLSTAHSVSLESQSLWGSTPSSPMKRRATAGGTKLAGSAARRPAGLGHAWPAVWRSQQGEGEHIARGNVVSRSGGQHWPG